MLPRLPEMEIYWKVELEDKDSIPTYRITMRPEIRFFQSFKIFLRSRKKHFLVQQMFFGSKCFSPFRSSRSRKKTIWFKKHFSFKMVILAQNGSFLLIFGSFWAILAPFWAQKCFFGSKSFYWFKMFFHSNPAGVAKNILNGKKQF